MELPIDHFRLLGVSPTTDAQTALRTLQQRLDRVPSDGYSLEALDARAELLRASADLLSDTERRSRYEADLTALTSSGMGVIPALDVPNSLEVGGLLLLLEAGQPLESFELANRALQPPQAPALGSSREADLTLVAAQACLAGAQDLHQQRRYEVAAQLIGQGQQLLQRMGQLPRQRQQLAEALEALAPYRVLDLLSRPLTASTERSEGLTMLADLVVRRGGLEGTADPNFSPEEFQAFFKQIRAYLTVQEQVDLFGTWAANSAAADFLTTTALTASGFAQRKPERIAAALQRLQASGQGGIDPMLGCLHLLLGQVEQGLACFEQGASPELKTWAQQQGDDGLTQLCAYCRDWLCRDVLPGYRDLEADADLDAYFADRDVQAYIERHDPRPTSPTSSPTISPKGSPADSPKGSPDEETQTAAATSPQSSAKTPTNPFAALAGELGLQGSTPPSNVTGEDSSQHGEDNDGRARWLWPDNWPWPQHWSLSLSWPAIPKANGRWLAAAALGAGVAAGAAVLVLRQGQHKTQALPVVPAPVAAPAQSPSAQSQSPTTPTSPTTPKSKAKRPAVPLEVANPTETELQQLLTAWLNAKAAVMAGKPSPNPLVDIARPPLVTRLNEERRRDEDRGQIQRVEANITAVKLLERSPQRVALQVNLTYQDSRLDGTGTTLESTPPTTLINRYVFARDGQSWRLAAFGPAN